jgi:hypothetical protein
MGLAFQGSVLTGTAADLSFEYARHPRPAQAAAATQLVDTVLLPANALDDVGGRASSSGLFRGGRQSPRRCSIRGVFQHRCDCLTQSIRGQP